MLDEIIQIDPEDVKTVVWNGDAIQYDLDLFALGEGLDGFLVVNPWVSNPYAYQAISDVPEVPQCVLWKDNDEWIAKYFHKNWTPEMGYKVIDLVPKMLWRKNQDLDRTMTFEDDPFAVYKPDVWEGLYELVWYMDPRFNPLPDKVWAISCKPIGRPSQGIKDMGYVTPKVNIEYNSELPDMNLDIDSMYPPYYDLANECAYQLDTDYTPFENIWVVKFKPAYRKPKPLMWIGTITPKFKIIHNPLFPKMDYDVEYQIPWRDFKYDHLWMLDKKHWAYTLEKEIWAFKIVSTEKPEGIKLMGDISPSFKIVHNPLLPKMEYDVDYTIPYHDFNYEHVWMLDEKHWAYSLEKEIWAFKIVSTEDNQTGSKVIDQISPIITYEYNPEIPNVRFDIDYTIPYHDFDYEHVWMLDEIHTDGFVDVDVWAVKVRAVKNPNGTKNIGSISPALEYEYNPVLPKMDYDVEFNVPYYDFKYAHFWMLDKKHCLTSPEDIWAVKVKTIGNDKIGDKYVGNISPRINLEFNPDIVGYAFDEKDVDIDNVQYHDFNYTLTWMLGKEYSGTYDMWAIKGTFVENPTGYKEMGNADPSTVITYNQDLANLKVKIDYKIPYHDRDYVHVWYLDKKFSSGEKIWVAKASAYDGATGEKDMGIVTPRLPDKLDVIFISYNETNAEENWQRVLEKAPYAKRVKGVKGIFEAHKAAAKLSDTDMFYVVDGDAYLSDQWQFNYQPGLFDRDCVYVWSSKNPVNDLIYGYGGVKLFSKRHLLRTRKWTNLDLTTSMAKLKVISKISNISNFNTDEFSTWRSAFREATKLYVQIKTEGDNVKTETLDRLEKWKTLGADRDFGQYSIDATSQAINFVNENYNVPDSMTQINDRKWLEIEFDKLYPGVRKN